MERLNSYRSRQQERNSHLDFVYRKIPAHTHPRSVSKSHQVLVSLYLRPPPFIVIRIQPPFRIKLVRVLSPQGLGLIDADDGDADESALGDKDAVGQLAGRGEDGVSEWEDVVDNGLRKWKMKRMFDRTCKSQTTHTSLVSSGTLGCFLNTSETNASR